MAKDPAFLFYPNDWLGGTMGMTFEEKGAYMELLMMQFNRGHLTSHMIGQAIGQRWESLKDKFETDHEGKFFNRRLEIEKEKRAKFTTSRRNNIEGKNQYSKELKKTGHKTKHMTGHMEDVNENRNIDVIKNKKGIDLKVENEKLRNSISEFIEHRRAKKSPIKTQMQYDKWLNKLQKDSDNDTGKAIEMIDNAIANGWTGVFSVDQSKKPTNGRENGSDIFKRITSGAGIEQNQNFLEP